MSINIKGIPKAAVLAALYNASRPLGMGFLHATSGDMTEKEASELLKQGSYFDYLRGRVMKVDLQGDQLDERLYDRDMGQGAAYEALRPLLATRAA